MNLKSIFKIIGKIVGAISSILGLFYLIADVVFDWIKIKNLILIIASLFSYKITIAIGYLLILCLFPLLIYIIIKLIIAYIFKFKKKKEPDYDPKTITVSEIPDVFDKYKLHEIEEKILLTIYKTDRVYIGNRQAFVKATFTTSEIKELLQIEEDNDFKYHLKDILYDNGYIQYTDHDYYKVSQIGRKYIIKNNIKEIYKDFLKQL